MAKRDRETLFSAMARNRPEWLAQALFVRAVETEPGVRRFLQERLGVAATPDDVPELDVECPTECGWRADVEIRGWRAQAVRVELKLLAGLTRRQENALREGRIDLLVAPKGSRVSGTGGYVVSWSDLAVKCHKDTLLRRLLKEVEVTFSWLLEAVDREVAADEFKQLLRGGDEARWRSLYRFLSTVHEHLFALDENYRASDGWTLRRRGTEPYYGFCFWLEEQKTPRFWLGFGWRKQGRVGVFCTVPSERSQRALKVKPTLFDAAGLATAVLSVARSYSRV